MLKYNLLYVEVEQKYWDGVKHIQNYGVYENVQNHVQNVQNYYNF